MTGNVSCTVDHGGMPCSWEGPTDPRLATLAEVLHDVECGNISAPSHGLHVNEAAAILAKLPPDWCGHAAIVEDMTTAYMVGEQKGRDACKAEITRLRKIEAAAIDVLFELDIVRAHNPDGGRDIVHIDTHLALRAALAGGSE